MMKIKTVTVNPYARQSRVRGHQSRGTAILAPIPQHAATAKILNTALPTIVPKPISPSVINVPITFTKSSGADVAAA